LKKITAIARILSCGVMSTPGVVDDGEVADASGIPGRIRGEPGCGSNTR
jgi:hypothetical protein